MRHYDVERKRDNVERDREGKKVAWAMAIYWNSETGDLRTRDPPLTVLCGGSPAVRLAAAAVCWAVCPDCQFPLHTYQWISATHGFYLSPSSVKCKSRKKKYLMKK